MNKVQAHYEKYREHLREIADIRFASAVLQWDQETYLPFKGNEIRGNQIATLNALAHQKFTDEKTGSLLLELLSMDGLSEIQHKNVLLSYEDFIKSKKLPSEFVKRTTSTTNRAFHEWIKARKENKFSYFQPVLQEVINDKLEESQLLGFEKHPYNALLNEFDKGQTVDSVDLLFEDLSKQLLPILQSIKQMPQVDDSFLRLNYDKNKQWEFGMSLLQQIHFDFDAGRQDLSEHPFTVSFNSNDVRLTTRIDENDLGNMVWSCIHEAGHGLYEQGLSNEDYGLPSGEACSLSIHESQSRLWENCVGRNLQFWKNKLTLLKKYFPDQLGNISAETFYKGINKVKPSLIRTEADELTYHFHVIIRYEIEKKLMEKNITASDIPEIWNAYYKKYLDVNVPDDKLGCLQDVHWSHGSFGYFATYSIGSLYAAQFWETIKTNTPEIEKEILSGNTIKIFEWLQQHIYSHGRLYSSTALCEKATYEPLKTEFFIRYIKDKYSYIYNT